MRRAEQNNNEETKPKTGVEQIAEQRLSLERKRRDESQDFKKFYADHADRYNYRPDDKDFVPAIADRLRAHEDYERILSSKTRVETVLRDHLGAKLPPEAMKRVQEHFEKNPEALAAFEENHDAFDRTHNQIKEKELNLKRILAEHSATTLEELTEKEKLLWKSQNFLMKRFGKKDRKNLLNEKFKSADGSGAKARYTRVKQALTEAGALSAELKKLKGNEDFDEARVLVMDFISGIQDARGDIQNSVKANFAETLGTEPDGRKFEQIKKASEYRKKVESTVAGTALGEGIAADLEQIHAAEDADEELQGALRKEFVADVARSGVSAFAIRDTLQRWARQPDIAKEVSGIMKEVVEDPDYDPEVQKAVKKVMQLFFPKALSEAKPVAAPEAPARRRFAMGEDLLRSGGPAPETTPPPTTPETTPTTPPPTPPENNPLVTRRIDNTEILGSPAAPAVEGTSELAAPPAPEAAPEPEPTPEVGPIVPATPEVAPAPEAAAEATPEVAPEISAADPKQEKILAKILGGIKNPEFKKTVESAVASMESAQAELAKDGVKFVFAERLQALVDGIKGSVPDAKGMFKEFRELKQDIVKAVDHIKEKNGPGLLDGIKFLFSEGGDIITLNKDGGRVFNKKKSFLGRLDSVIENAEKAAAKFQTYRKEGKEAALRSDLEKVQKRIKEKYPFIYPSQYYDEHVRDSLDKDMVENMRELEKILDEVPVPDKIKNMTGFDKDVPPFSILLDRQTVLNADIYQFRIDIHDKNRDRLKIDVQNIYEQIIPDQIADKQRNATAQKERAAEIQARRSQEQSKAA